MAEILSKTQILFQDFNLCLQRCGNALFFKAHEVFENRFDQETITTGIGPCQGSAAGEVQ